MLAGLATLVVFILAVTTQHVQPTTSYIFLLDSKCWWDMQAEYAKNFALPTPELDGYLGKYEIICFGGLKDMWTIEFITAPILRALFPQHLFVFVYPHETMTSDFNKHLWYTRGHLMKNYPLASQMAEGKGVVLGYADVQKGIGFASDEYPYSAKHELAHLRLCGTWHDGDGRTLQKLQQYPGAADLPWCRAYIFLR